VVNGAAARASEPMYRLVPDDRLHELGPPAWLVDDFLPQRGLAVLFGPRGAFKTFLLLHLAACVATGRRFYGRRAIRGWVAYVLPEGVQSLDQRLAAWRESHGHRGRIGIGILPRSIQLLRLTESVVPLAAAIDAMPGVSGPPALIIVDTLSRNAPGLRENQQDDMSLVVASCDYLRDRYKCTVVLAHHTRKGDSELRGSSVLDGAADTVIKLEREGRMVTVSCVKQKDAEEFAPFTLERVNVGQSCVLQDVNAEALDRQLPGYCHEALQALADISTSEGVSNLVWMRSVVQGTRISERTFYRSKKLLLERGYAMQVYGGRRFALTPAGQELLPTDRYCHELPMAERTLTATTAGGRSPAVAGSNPGPDDEAPDDDVLERIAIQAEEDLP
jgi:hypothetical protein